MGRYGCSCGRVIGDVIVDGRIYCHGVDRYHDPEIMIRQGS